MNKLFIIRHGQSFFNECKDINRGINPLFIDSKLTIKGINQAKNISNKFKELKFNAIFVSPLYRCLQTAFYIFENHHDAKSINIYVHPLITEISNSISNFTYSISESKKIFNKNTCPKFDWHFFDEYIEKKNLNENLFFFNNIDGLINKKDIYENILNNLNKNNIKEIKDIYSKIMIDKFNSGNKLESMEFLKNRVIEFKNFLKETMKNKNILLISHSAFLKQLTGKEKIINCELIELNI